MFRSAYCFRVHQNQGGVARDRLRHRAGQVVQDGTDPIAVSPGSAESSLCRGDLRLDLGIIRGRQLQQRVEQGLLRRLGGAGSGMPSWKILSRKRYPRGRPGWPMASPKLVYAPS